MNPRSYDSAPRHLNALNTRLANIAKADGGNELRLRAAIANTIVAQMLPPGVVKGGTAMKLRVGETASRFTTDLDAARAANATVEDYIDEFDQRLTKGWNGFTGRIRKLQPAEPLEIPADYVMQPFEVKLAYLAKSWLTVTFELGHDEIGSTADPKLAIAETLIELFRQLGLPDPAPVPLLAVEHQIAQKLHACTTPNRLGGNDRAHDLVDLQILVECDPPDLTLLANIGRRLFAARRVTQWPPTVTIFPSWEQIYTQSAEGLGVRSLPDAVVWANILIDQANAGGSTGP
jgi:hypothetical protein